MCRTREALETQEKILPRDTTDMDVDTFVSEMFQNADKPGFLIDSIEAKGQVLRYGKFNRFENDDHPKMVERGAKRTINIHVSLSGSAEWDKPTSIL